MAIAYISKHLTIGELSHSDTLKASSTHFGMYWLKGQQDLELKYSIIKI